MYVSWIMIGCVGVLSDTVEYAGDTDLIQEWISSSEVTETSPWTPTRTISTTSYTQPQRQLAANEEISSFTCDKSIYESFLQNEGKDMFVQASICEASIQYLKTRLAGRFGPVLQSDMEIVMCSDSCVQSDVLHQSAMERSRCTCTELSSESYITQDFCRQNSARMLCSILGVCGTWECGLHDFMCPRYDWDRMYPCSSNQMKLSTIILIFIAYLVV